MITEINSLRKDMPDEIIRNLNVLYSTVEGTVVGDRRFGIDNSLLDLPIHMAKARLVSEYTLKTKKYEPRVKVIEVHTSANDEGELKTRVVIDWI